jgi:hypothetical protein
MGSLGLKGGSALGAGGVLADAVSVAGGFTSSEGEDMAGSVGDLGGLEGEFRNSPNGVGSMRFRYLNSKSVLRCETILLGQSRRLELIEEVFETCRYFSLHRRGRFRYCS